ncbi:MAG TPA: hypothetical protein VM282_11780 [Acidimicrobiales bacterium]|nr:hypothetical protein [Acidimicrobiales bacterium]
MADATTGRSRAIRVVVLGVAAAIVAVVAVVIVRDGDDAQTAGASTTAPETSVPSTTVAATTSVAPSTGAPVSTAATATVAPATGGDFVAVTPTRLVDTRTGVGTTEARAGKAPLVTASIAGRAGAPAPAAVKALALNVTIAEPSQAGFLTVAAAGSRPSDVSQIAFVSATASSLIVTRASAEGLVELRLSDGASSHIIVDLLGYFVSVRSLANLSIVPEAQPRPLFDSRTGPLVEPGRTVDVTLPAPQAGAVLGVTATEARGTGYFTVYGGSTRPDTSAVNFAPGHDATALAIVATSTDRVVHIYNGSAAAVHVVVFQIARLEAGVSAGGLALNIEGTIAQDGRSAPFPFRTVDTRGTATCPVTIGGGVSSIASIFPKAKALLVSVTVVDASVASYLTAYSGSAQPPSVATLNFGAREVRSNLALVPVSGDRVNIVCGAGSPEYILDVLATLE